MDNSRKRRIPRHVDGRVMIGRMYWKSFVFKFIPIMFLLLVFLFNYFTPLTLFFTVSAGGFLFFILSEINNKVTGMDILKDYLKYKKQGTLVYERSTKNDSTTFRYIRHKEK